MKTENTPKGMRSLVGNEALLYSRLIQKFSKIALDAGFEQWVLPSVWSEQTFVDKAGPEIVEQMYTFPDKSGRKLCLPPEGTAIAREIYLEKYRKQQTVNLFYVQKFYRYEQPQAGRYREFTQFGIESMGPKAVNTLPILKTMLAEWPEIVFDCSVKRGLDYYIADGFEARYENLGAQKQVAGGGKYDVGEGFAIGIDRIMLIPKVM